MKLKCKISCLHCIDWSQEFDYIFLLVNIYIGIDHLKYHSKWQLLGLVTPAVITN